MKPFRLQASAMLLCLVIFAATSAVAATDYQIDLMNDAIVILEDNQNAADRNIPASLMREAKGILIFPRFVKGGFMFGARFGRGVVSVRDKNTGAWGTPSFITTSGFSFGLQAGVEFTDLILLIMSYDAVNSLLNGQFEVGADIGAAIGPVGRHAEADYDILLQGATLSYSHSKGAFAGVAVGVVAISLDGDQNEIFYGKKYSPAEILTDGAVDPKDVPESCRRFLQLINRNAPGPKF